MERNNHPEYRAKKSTQLEQHNERDNSCPNQKTKRTKSVVSDGQKASLKVRS